MLRRFPGRRACAGAATRASFHLLKKTWTFRKSGTLQDEDARGSRKPQLPERSPGTIPHLGSFGQTAGLLAVWPSPGRPPQAGVGRKQVTGAGRPPSSPSASSSSVGPAGYARLPLGSRVLSSLLSPLTGAGCLPLVGGTGTAEQRRGLRAPARAAPPAAVSRATRAPTMPQTWCPAAPHRGSSPLPGTGFHFSAWRLVGCQWRSESASRVLKLKSHTPFLNVE